jgi:hypothetical protein
VGNLVELILVASVASLPFGLMTREHGMNVIMIRCPETGSEISTGIECEDDDFRSLPFVITHTTCPSCGREHSWSKSDAWLNDGTSDLKGGQMDDSSVSKGS